MLPQKNSYYIKYVSRPDGDDTAFFTYYRDVGVAQDGEEWDCGDYFCISKEDIDFEKACYTGYDNNTEASLGTKVSQSFYNDLVLRYRKAKHNIRQYCYRHKGEPLPAFAPGICFCCGGCIGKVMAVYDEYIDLEMIYFGEYGIGKSDGVETERINEFPNPHLINQGAFDWAYKKIRECSREIMTIIRDNVPVYFYSGEKSLPFSVERNKQAYILMGIQASGKTTFYSDYLSRCEHINLDELHSRFREKIEIDACIERGISFVIDNTNPQIADRAKYISLAKEHGYTIIGLFFQSIVRDCIRRNELRERKVPRLAIPGTSKKLEMPSYNEGFDQLFYVKMKDKNFEVTKWEDNI